MAITTRFNRATGVLDVFGDSGTDAIVVSRDAAGNILVNGLAVADRPTIANTGLIEVFGQAGNDAITLDETNGALPAAQLFGGRGNDTITGGSGGDLLFGEDGNDRLLGKGGADLLFGGAGDDVLTGGDGDDQMFGGTGNDRFIWNPGDDTDLAEGGDGLDTVEVNGGNGAESFTITANGDRVRIDRVSPAPFAIDAGTVEEIVINAAGGDDTISAAGNLAALVHLTLDGGDGNDTILGSNGSDVLLGGDGNDFVDGQQGNDIARLGAGDDVFQWDPGDGSDVVEGDAGVDAMRFNGSNIGENMEISANGNRVLFTRNVGNITMDLHNVERVDVNAVGGSDNIVVSDLTQTAVRNVAIDLSGTAGSGVGDAAADNVVVNATQRSDRINIAGNGSTILVTGLTAQVSVSGAEGANDRLTIKGFDGNDIINAAALQAGLVNLVVDGGAGNDTITGSGGNDMLLGDAGNDTIIGGAGADVASLGDGDDVFVWNPGDGSDTVEGGAGTDTLRFAGSGAREFFDVSASGDHVRLFRDVGSITMDMHGVEHIAIDGGADDDHLTIGDLTGTGVTDVAFALGAADGFADSVVVNATNGDDHVTVKSSGNSVLVSGLSEQVTISQSEANDSLTINGQLGNDIIDASALRAGQLHLEIDGGLGADVITGSRGDDLIFGGRDNDTMRGGAGNDTFVWNPGDGSDVIDGQTGTDTQLFNGSNVSENFDISAQPDGHVRLSRDVGSIVQDLSSVETIELNTFGGADKIVIGDLTGTGVQNVHVRLGAPADDGLADTFLVNGTSGDDVITLSLDANGSLVISGLASRVVIDNFDFLNDTVQIAGLAGNDVIDASAIDAALGPHLILDGGAGDDVLVGGAGNDTLLGGAGDDVLLGGPGTDVLDGGPGDNIVIQSAAFEFPAVSDFHLV